MDKKSIEDIWPINKKRFIIRVDFNVTVNNERIQNDLRIRAALPTIRHVIDKGGMVILISHIGRPKGVDMRKVNAKSREHVLATWEAERGTGMTNYFASLTGAEKVALLQKSSQPPAKLEPTRGTGKTVAFSQLPFPEKKRLLDDFTGSTNRAQDRNFYSVESTLKPVAAALRELLDGVTVHFAPDVLSANDLVRNKMKPGEVAILENLRFYVNEMSTVEEERMIMAKLLAAYGDYYVFDAFASMHRSAASLLELPRLMMHGAQGYLVETELKKISAAVSNPVKPLGLVLGGNNHIKEYLVALDAALHRLDKLILVGGVGQVFLKAQGLSVGTYVYDAELVKLAKNILDRARQEGLPVILPVDHVTVIGGGKLSISPDGNVPADTTAMDIGPQSVALITREIRTCRTVVWVGVAGVVEKEPFHEGTVAIAKALAQPKIYSVVAGRSTAMVVHSSGYTGAITHLSTGGSIVITLMTEHSLVGFKSLSDRGRIEGASSTYAVSVTDHFQSLRLFSRCSERVLSALVKKVIRKVYEDGEVLAHEGDRCAMMYVVAQGTLRLQEGQNGVVRFAREGDSVAMMHFLNNNRSEYTVSSVGQTTTYILSTEAFSELCSTMPAFSLEVTRNLCSQQRGSVVSSAGYGGDGFWTQVAESFDRTPNPVGVLPQPPRSNTVRDRTKLGFASRVSHWVAHLASELVARATVQPPTPQEIALTTLSVTGLHASYHRIHQVILAVTGVNAETNPLLRILVAQDSVAIASFAVSYANPSLAATWLHTSLAAMCTQIVQGLVAGKKRTPSALVGLLSSILVALLFSRSLKLVQRTTLQVTVYTILYVLLQRPVFSLVEGAINAAGMKRSPIERRDF